MKIHIRNLRLRAIIGIFDWERKNKQDLIINLTLDVSDESSCQSDQIKDTVDYKSLTKKIIKQVESSEFFLIEKLAQTILNLCLVEQRVQHTTVTIDKPHALRFADSVAIELSKSR